MSFRFDTNDDLWIELDQVSTGQIEKFGPMMGCSIARNHPTIPGGVVVVQEFNLTAYIRSLTEGDRRPLSQADLEAIRQSNPVTYTNVPNWAAAAMTNSTANIEITSTGGTMWMDDGKPKDAA